MIDLTWLGAFILVIVPSGYGFYSASQVVYALTGDTMIAGLAGTLGAIGAASIVVAIMLFVERIFERKL